MNHLLSVENITKHFGGVRALDGVTLQVNAGRTLALIGENGAGKSTLGKIIAGVHAPDTGLIRLDGAPAQFHGPMDAQRQGVAIIFQELDLFPNLTIAENIAIGNIRMEPGLVVRFAHLERLCRPFLDAVDLDIASDTLLAELPIGHMQLVAIARALSMEARLIVMDEPTSSLTDDAVDNLFRLIHKLRDLGKAIVFVSHKMDEIFRVADDIAVLRDGRFIGSKPVGETNVQELIGMMVGREISNIRPSRENKRNTVLLSVNGMSTEKLRDISFDLRAGEVLGVAGLVGAGRSEIGAALFGIDPILKGDIELQGQSYNPRSPRRAMRRGFGLLPEDRKLQGLMMGMNVRENASLSILPRVARAGFVRRAQESELTEKTHRRVSLKAASPEIEINALSGGNQQKVLLSRWLLVDPSVIFLDDPTRGIDVGAKQDIYNIIEEMAQSGKGVILVSSELPELFRCCDRILVLHDGKGMGVLETGECTQEEIMTLATRSNIIE